MNNPTADVFDAIQEAAEEAIAKARERQDEMGAVNWGDIGVLEVLFCRDRGGGTIWRIVIEEAAPGSPLANFVYAHLGDVFRGTSFDVATEW